MKVLRGSRFLWHSFKFGGSSILPKAFTHLNLRVFSSDQNERNPWFDHNVHVLTTTLSFWGKNYRSAVGE